MAKQIKVLHVDDDPFMLEMYKIFFEMANTNVTSWTTPPEDYVSEIAALNPDIIISDCIRPAPNGLDVLKVLKADERTKRIPFIFLSSMADSLRETGENLGAVDFITKAEHGPPEVIERILKIVGSPLPVFSLFRVRVALRRIKNHWLNMVFELKKLGSR